MALLQDPILGCPVRAHDAARVYDATHAGKNRVLEQRHSVTDYSNGRAMLLPTQIIVASASPVNLSKITLSVIQ